MPSREELPVIALNGIVDTMEDFWVLFPLEFSLNTSLTPLDANQTVVTITRLPLTGTGTLHYIGLDGLPGDPLPPAPVNISFGINATAHVVYIPPINKHGSPLASLRFSVSIANNRGDIIESPSAVVFLSVASLEDPPQVYDVFSDILVGQESIIQLNAFDADTSSDDLIMYIVELPQTGLLYQYSNATSSGSILGDSILSSWTVVSDLSRRVVFVASSPGLPFASFSYIAEDASSYSSPGTVRINSFSNSSLSAISMQISLNEDDFVVFELSSNFDNLFGVVETLPARGHLYSVDQLAAASGNVTELSTRNLIFSVPTYLDGRWLAFRPDFDEYSLNSEYSSFAFCFVNGFDHQLSNTATVNFTVVMVNDPPLVWDLQTMSTHGAEVEINLLGMVLDPEGDSLIAYINTLPLVGDLYFNGSLLSSSLTFPLPLVNFTCSACLIYRPASGSYISNFSVYFSDGNSDSEVAWVIFSVGGFNIAPWAFAGTIDTYEDSIFLYTFHGTDERHDWIPVITGLPLSGQLWQVDKNMELLEPIDDINVIVSSELRQIAYIPNPDWNGDDEFFWKARDAHREYSLAPSKIQIRVNPVEDAPDGISRITSVQEDAVLFVHLELYDVDSSYENSTLNCFITVLPEHGTIYQIVVRGEEFLLGDPISSAFTGVPRTEGLFIVAFVPDFNEYGSSRDSFWYAEFSYAGSDSFANGTDATITVLVTPVNDSPVPLNSSHLLVEDHLYLFSLDAFDAEGDSWFAQIMSLPQFGSLFQVQMEEGNLLVGDVISFVDTIVEDGQSRLWYLPDLNVNSPPIDNFTFMVTDYHYPNSLFSRREYQTSYQLGFVFLNISAENDAPSCENFNSLSIFEDNLTLIRLPSFDPETAWQNLSAVIISIPNSTLQGQLWLSIDGVVRGDPIGVIGSGCPLPCVLPSESWFFFESALNFVGEIEIGFLTSDGELNSTCTLNLSVENVNDAPVALFSFVSCTEDDLLVLELEATDVEGDTLSSFITGLPSQGKLYQYSLDYFGVPDLSSSNLIRVTDQILDPFRRVVYQPPEQVNGETNFTVSFRVYDGNLFSNTGEVTINVTGLNDPPIVSEDILTVWSSDVLVPVMWNCDDPDGETDLLILVGNFSSPGLFRIYNESEVASLSLVDVAVTQTTPRGTPAYSLSALSFGTELRPGLEIWSSSLVLFWPGRDMGWGPKAGSNSQYSHTLGFTCIDSSNTNDTGQVQLEVACQPGEVVNVWEHDDSVCIVCPYGAICASDGSDFMIVADGHYMMSSISGALMVLQCVPEEACIATAEGVAVCAEGYASNSIRCGTCDVGYFRSGKGCRSCQQTHRQFFELMAFLVVVLLQFKQIRLGLLYFVDFLQIQIVCFSIGLSWPDRVVQSIEPLIFLSGSLNLDCFMTSYSFLNRWSLNVVLPFVVVAVLFVVKQTAVVGVVRHLQMFSFIVSLASLLFLPASLAFAEIFWCVTLLDGTTVLLAQPSEFCDQTWWYETAASAAFGCAVIFIAVALAVGWIVFKARPNETMTYEYRGLKLPHGWLDSNSSPPPQMEGTEELLTEWKNSFIFMTIGLVHSAFFWPFIYICRNIAIVITMLVLARTPIVMSFYVMAWVALMLYLHWSKQPYDCEYCNGMQSLSLVAPLVTLTFGVAFTAFEEEFIKHADFLEHLYLLLFYFCLVVQACYSVRIFHHHHIEGSAWWQRNKHYFPCLKVRVVPCVKEPPNQFLGDLITNPSSDEKWNLFVKSNDIAKHYSDASVEHAKPISIEPESAHNDIVHCLAAVDPEGNVGFVLTAVHRIEIVQAKLNDDDFCQIKLKIDDRGITSGFALQLLPEAAVALEPEDEIVFCKIELKFYPEPVVPVRLLPSSASCAFDDEVKFELSVGDQGEISCNFEMLDTSHLDPKPVIEIFVPDVQVLPTGDFPYRGGEFCFKFSISMNGNASCSVLPVPIDNVRVVPDSSDEDLVVVCFGLDPKGEMYDFDIKDIPDKTQKLEIVRAQLAQAAAEEDELALLAAEAAARAAKDEEDRKEAEACARAAAASKADDKDVVIFDIVLFFPWMKHVPGPEPFERCVEEIVEVKVESAAKDVELEEIKAARLAEETKFLLQEKLAEIEAIEKKELEAPPEPVRNERSKIEIWPDFGDYDLLYICMGVFDTGEVVMELDFLPSQEELDQHGLLEEEEIQQIVAAAIEQIVSVTEVCEELVANVVDVAAKDEQELANLHHDDPFENLFDTVQPTQHMEEASESLLAVEHAKKAWLKRDKKKARIETKEERLARFKEEELAYQAAVEARRKKMEDAKTALEEKEKILRAAALLPFPGFSGLKNKESKKGGLLFKKEKPKPPPPSPFSGDPAAVKAVVAFTKAGLHTPKPKKKKSRTKTKMLDGTSSSTPRYGDVGDITSPQSNKNTEEDILENMSIDQTIIQEPSENFILEQEVPPLIDDHDGPSFIELADDAHSSLVTSPLKPPVRVGFATPDVSGRPNPEKVQGDVRPSLDVKSVAVPPRSASRSQLPKISQRSSGAVRLLSTLNDLISDEGKNVVEQKASRAFMKVMRARQDQVDDSVSSQQDDRVHNSNSNVRANNTNLLDEVSVLDLESQAQDDRSVGIPPVKNAFTDPVHQPELNVPPKPINLQRAKVLAPITSTSSEAN